MKKKITKHYELPEIMVKGKKPLRYIMKPEDLLDFISSLTGGLFSFFSPTLVLRKAYDVSKSIKKKEGIDKIGKALFQTNNGIVTKKFEREHPIGAAITNLIGDVAIPVGLLGTAKGINYLARMDMPRFGYTPTTKYLFAPGYAGSNASPIIKVPDGYTFVREVELRGKDGVRKVHLVKDLTTGKTKILEDLDKAVKETPKQINLSRYNGEPLTGNEPGFDKWAKTRTPENDHFPDLSHGINDIRDLLPLMNKEFESLPNGSRVDLGEIFSSDSSSNLLLFVRRNNKRIKMVLPDNPDKMVRTNDHGTRGIDSERIFNELLEKLLDLHGYSPEAVPKAKYDSNTNTLSVPLLSFIKLHRKGNKIWK